MKTYESYKSHNDIKKIADEDLEKGGHYKDDDGFWWIGHNLDISRRWIYNGELTIKIAEVRGDVGAESLGLTSLIGFPKAIKGDINLIDNYITDFKDSPIKEVSGTMYVSQNELTSLEGAPEKAKNFYYHRNSELFSLIGAPKVTGDRIGAGNEGTKIHTIESLWYSSVAGKDWENRSLSLLNYLINRLNANVFTEEDFNKALDEIYWPEGFLNDDLIKSLRGINKYKL